jgi:hypothetical protein
MLPLRGVVFYLRTTRHLKRQNALSICKILIDVGSFEILKWNSRDTIFCQDQNEVLVEKRQLRRKRSRLRKAFADRLNERALDGQDCEVGQANRARLDVLFNRFRSIRGQLA